MTNQYIVTHDQTDGESPDWFTIKRIGPFGTYEDAESFVVNAKKARNFPPLRERLVIRDLFAPESYL